jgi:uncharacterized protein YdeI (YjbR/CyaY-like superfamily)
MGKKDPRVDEYIAKAQPFARPILTHIRKVVHEVCPKAEETLKWKMPTFMYEDEMLVGMAAFKEHAVLGFWKAKLILDRNGRRLEDDAMGQFGCIRSVKDLPPKRELTGYLKKAMELNEQGIKVARAKPAANRAPARTPADLAAALRKSRKAAATWDGFAPSHRREYIEWITEAKQDATRERRLAQAIEWLEEGRSRNWKYQRR